MLEHVLEADQKVILRHRRDEVQAELARGGFDAQRHGGGRRHMAVLGGVVMAQDLLAGHVLRGEQVREQEPRA